MAYNDEEANFIYTKLYQHRRLLAGASIIPTPDGSMTFRLSGEGAVLLLAELRELRKQLGIPEPPDDPWFADQKESEG